MSNTTRLEVAFEQLKSIFSVRKRMMQPGSTLEEIRDLQQQCMREFGWPVPDRYLDLLRLANGLNWNGAYFYGTRDRPYADIPDLTLSGIPEQTAQHRYWLPGLVLGQIEDQYFCYNSVARQYQAYVVGDGQPYQSFAEFDELFSYAFESRWPKGGRA